MDSGYLEGSLWRRFLGYCVELRGIERKLGNNIPLGKREKLVFRQQDIKNRLIPDVVAEIQK